MADIVHLDPQNFESTITKSPTPVLVDFWAEWCGPCRMIAPVLEQIAQEREGNLKVCKLDVDSYPEVAEKLMVNSIPTLIVFKDGQEVGRRVGAYPKESLDRYLNDLLQ